MTVSLDQSYAHCRAVANSARRAATAMGLVIGFGEITGGVISPLIAGALADRFSLAMPLIMATVMPLIAAVLALGLIETNPRFVTRAIELPI